MTTGTTEPVDRKAAPGRRLWFRTMQDIAADVEKMCKSSPVFGPMDHEEWERLHCRHAEMHFGFIHPPGG